MTAGAQRAPGPRRATGLKVFARCLALSLAVAMASVPVPTEAQGSGSADVAAAGGIDDSAPFTSPVEEARYQALTRQLRCLVCQNESIADSQATLAGDLRREIRAMLQAGRSDTEIRRFMTDRYGEFVLYDPPLSLSTLGLWFGPAVLLVIGAVVLFRRLRRMEASAVHGPELDAAQQKRVQRFLEEHR